MIRIIKASFTIDEADLQKLLTHAEETIATELKFRGLNEYIDDVKWGEGMFEIPIFYEPKPGQSTLSAKFRFAYDPEDEDYPYPGDQLEVKLAEFIDDLNWEDDTEEEYYGEDYIRDAITDVCEQVKDEFGNSLSSMEFGDEVMTRLENRPYILFAEDDYDEDILWDIVGNYI